MVTFSRSPLWGTPGSVDLLGSKTEPSFQLPGPTIISISTIIALTVTIVTEDSLLNQSRAEDSLHG